jgi:predicted metal-dependent hydrolase
LAKSWTDIAAIINQFQGQQLDAHYLAYFECFNRRLYFEAHEVLETIWLPQRGQPNGLFYQGLIQLAGAFVHLQKQRPEPAVALFKLAQKNLSRYTASHEQLDVQELLTRIEQWLRQLEEGINPLSFTPAPVLTRVV